MKERPVWDLNPYLCDVIAVLYQLSSQSNWEYGVMWVDYKPIDVEICDGKTRICIWNAVWNEELDHCNFYRCLIKQQRARPKKLSFTQLVEHCTHMTEVRVQIAVQAWNLQAFLAAAYAVTKNEMIKFIHSTMYFKYNSCITITYGIIHIQATKREEWHICSIHLPLAFTVAVSSSSANSSLTCSPRMLSRTFSSTPSLPTKTQQKISVTTQTNSVIAIFTRLCSQKRHDSPSGSKWDFQTITINN